jgi:hypothetical protein
MNREDYTPPPVPAPEPYIENAYCVFATEAEANTGLQTIYANMVAAIASPDLLDVTTDQVIPQEDLTEEERAEYESDNRRFPIFGTNAATGVKNAEQGYTTSWAVAQETLEGKWVFQKPESQFLDGVTGYVVEPYDPDWFPTPTMP